MSAELQPQKRRGTHFVTQAMLALTGVALAGGLLVYGVRERSRQWKLGECGALLSQIAQAQEKRRAAFGHYLDISGRTKEGRLESLYPAAHPSDVAVPWIRDACPDDDSKKACNSLKALAVYSGVAIWYRYGGTSGVGVEECRLVTRSLGLPEPPETLNGSEWFVLIAVDGEAAKEARAYTSWDRKVHTLPGPLR